MASFASSATTSGARKHTWTNDWQIWKLNKFTRKKCILVFRPPKSENVPAILMATEMCLPFYKIEIAMFWVKCPCQICVFPDVPAR